MKCICGILSADEGKIIVNETDIQTNLLKVKRTIGYLPEHNPLYLEMYVKEYLSYVVAFYITKIK
jgi:ABC-2 type transport system ATP-binding protein